MSSMGLSLLYARYINEMGNKFLKEAEEAENNPKVTETRKKFNAFCENANKQINGRESGSPEMI